MKKRTIFAVLMLLSALALLGADLTGTWGADVVLDAGTGAATFTFKQSGEALTGTYAGTFGQSPLKGTVKGDQAEWEFDNDQVGKIVYKATMDGASKMKGTVEYGQLGKGTFTAVRK